ncbi:uncharacterized protein [Coffea arabica]|uniref:Uncharacterized protein isoform X2 n=1 Tax=Coffea arabica TaxID=13443 RepID=A0ABM4UIR0_COFAR
MFIVGHRICTRAVQELFGYSGETISCHFNNVLMTIMAISWDVFPPPRPDVPPEFVKILNLSSFSGLDEQVPFWNKSGFLSQNVRAVCSFSMKFHYVLAGWEGSAPDVQILGSAVTKVAVLGGTIRSSSSLG